MSSELQLGRYFSDLHQTSLHNLSALQLVSDDASVPTRAQMRRAQRGAASFTGRRSEGPLSLDRWSYHVLSSSKSAITPKQQKGLERWSASPSQSSLSSNSSSLTVPSPSKNSNIKWTPSSDELLALPRRSWKDDSPSASSSTKTRAATNKGGMLPKQQRRSSSSAVLQRSDVLLVEPHNTNSPSSKGKPQIKAKRRSSPSLLKESAESFREEYICSLLSSLSKQHSVETTEEEEEDSCDDNSFASESDSCSHGSSTSSSHKQRGEFLEMDQPSTPVKQLISRAIDISNNALRGAGRRSGRDGVIPPMARLTMSPKAA